MKREWLRARTLRYSPSMKKKQKNKPPPSSPLAVVDIGSSAIRMTIAAVAADGTVRAVESLQQSVSIGRDTFTKGFIEKTTVEECVRALRHFARVLQEHGFSDNDRVRVVATTAVREASNREAFRDRVHIATGWQIEVLDLADIARLTYMGVLPYLHKREFAAVSDLLVVEMGGGTTEVCFISRGSHASSQTFRIGSLRLRQTVDNFKLSSAQKRQLLQQEIRRTISQIAPLLGRSRKCAIVALGSEMRFAAAELDPSWEGTAPVAIGRSALTALTDAIAALSIEKLVKKYHLSFGEAETIVPVLHFYLQLAQELGARRIIVASTSLRHGILMEMAGYGDRKEQGGFGDLILASAKEVARKYHAEMAHAEQVARLAGTMFTALADEHRLRPRHALLLAVAAILHDIGFFIGPRNHHKHSMYLIRNSELFGLNSREITIVSLVARYHRRSPPKPSHAEYMELDFSDRIAVAKLSAILRVADALDNAHAGRVRSIRCEIGGGRFVMTAPANDDVSLEEIAVQNKGQFFEDVYGLKPIVRAGA
jgi:exopolyphosphatase / guanosine-5'-triphosphate,3'-diphosphate pyrophosphatase